MSSPFWFCEPQRLTILLLTMILPIACARPKPSSESLTIDDFQYSDNARARESWIEQDGAPPVVMADSGDWGARKVMQLPCGFSSFRNRCYWDQLVRLDLSKVRELELEIYVPDPQAVSEFTLYFRSGSGWYRRGIDIVEPGWQKLHFLLPDFASEDQPKGWDQIDLVRISSWVEPPAHYNFLVLGKLHGFLPKVVLIRDEASQDSDTMKTTITSVSSWLSQYHVPYSVIDGADVEKGFLTGTKMAILPFNESPSEAQLVALEKFVAAGGKLMLFYYLPERLGALLGMRRIAWDQGEFGAYRFADKLIAHLPERVQQNSWNITVAAPNKAHNARVIATWEDGQGRPTIFPAWLASDNGLFMSHIPLNYEFKTGPILLLTLIGYYVPEIWPIVVAEGIEQIGRVGPFASLSEARTGILTLAPHSLHPKTIAQEISTVDTLKAQIQVAAQGNNQPQSLIIAESARRHMLQAFYAAQSPQTPEFRGVWEPTGLGLVPGDWAATMDVLLQHGFNALFPNVIWTGQAHFDSTVLRHSQSFQRYGDQLDAIVQTAHERGLKVHAWVASFSLQTAPANWIASLRESGRTQVSADGKPYDWLCPSHPENFAMLHDALREMVERYDIDGVHLDYIRYPDDDHCYCSGCRSRFQQQTGLYVSQWPSDVRPNGKLEKAFLDWRRFQITRLVEAIYYDTKAAKPQVQLSAAVFPDAQTARDSVAQDWGEWMRLGIVDFLCPMNYTQDLAAFASIVNNQPGHGTGPVPIYPGIRATLDTGLLGPDAVISQILAARTAQTGGFVLFSLDQAVGEELLPALGMGTTATKPSVTE